MIDGTENPPETNEMILLRASIDINVASPRLFINALYSGNEVPFFRVLCSVLKVTGYCCGVSQRSAC